MSERENQEKERQKKKPRQKEERRKECVRSWRASEADDHFSIFSWNCRDYFFPTLSTCASKIAGCAPPAHRQLWWKVIMKVCQGGCQNLRLSPSTSAPGGFSTQCFWRMNARNNNLSLTCIAVCMKQPLLTGVGFVWICTGRYWQVPRCWVCVNMYIYSFTRQYSTYCGTERNSRNADW